MPSCGVRTSRTAGAVLIYELEEGISEALTGLPLEQQKKIVCGAAERAFGV